MAPCLVARMLYIYDVTCDNRYNVHVPSHIAMQAACTTSETTHQKWRHTLPQTRLMGQRDRRSCSLSYREVRSIGSFSRPRLHTSWMGHPRSRWRDANLLPACKSLGRVSANAECMRTWRPIYTSLLHTARPNAEMHEQKRPCTLCLHVSQSQTTLSAQAVRA